MTDVDPVTEVLIRSGTMGNERVVIVLLARRADNEGYCWPGNEELMRLSKLGERAVRQILEKLRDKGEIATLKARGKHHYSLHRILLWTDDPNAGNEETMLRWLRSKSGPYMERMYASFVKGHQRADNQERGMVVPIFGITPERGTTMPVSEPGKGNGGAARKGNGGAAAPAAYRNEHPDSEREEHTPTPSATRDTAQTMFAWYIDTIRARTGDPSYAPEQTVAGRLLKLFKNWLDRTTPISADLVREVVEEWSRTDLSVSVLSDMMDARRRGGQPRWARAASNGTAKSRHDPNDAWAGVRTGDEVEA